MERIIISGVSRGIGFELLNLAIKNNIEVIGLSRNLNPVEHLASDCVSLFELDLSKPESFEALKNYLADNKTKKTALIHNAGYLVNKPFETISQEEFLKVYQVNVFGLALLSQTVLPYCLADSHVLTLSSMGGIQGSMKFPGLAAYSSAKGAAITLSELLAEEYKDRKIAFNVVALGAVQTEMLEEAFPGYKAPIGPRDMAEYLFDLALKGHKIYNGKILQASSSTP
ncbi:MAG: SDR family NAD(P)-dependent oxidoreductase [Flavobacteriaceae bacterium]